MTRRPPPALPLAAALAVAPSACSDSGAGTATQATDAEETTAGPAGASTAATGETTGAAAGWSVSLPLGPADGALLSVWGRAPDDVFTVGGQPEFGDDPGFGRAFHFDGVEWAALPLPDATPRLNWVHGTDATVWAVGERGVIVSRLGEDDWVVEPSGSDQTLWGVWGPSDDALWAVGGDGINGVPTLLRREGGAWTTIPVPALAVESKGLFKVWGSSPTDVHVVGDLGAQLHFDGATWTALANESIADLISVWGLGQADAIAVGGRSSARVSRWDGAAWSGMTLTGEPGLSGVWVDDAGEATIVGAQGTVWRLAPGSFTPAPAPLVTQHFLHAVTGFSDGTRFAVGGSLLTQPPHVGVALIYTPG